MSEKKVVSFSKTLIPHKDLFFNMTSRNGEKEPLIEPRVIRAMRKRPRLVDDGFREELLRNIENNVENRRKPQNFASGAAMQAAEVLADSVAPVAEDIVGGIGSKANETVLSRL